MAGYYYVDNQGFFKTISSQPIVKDDWTQITSLPPGDDNLYRWDFDSSSWQIISNNEAAIASGDEATQQQATVLNDSSTSTEVLRSQKIVVLGDSDSLNIGNDFTDWDNLDLLYYKDKQPTFKNNGVSITARGFLAFPQLTWDKTKESRTTSFIFFVASDNRYFLLGLGSRERYNFDSNSYTQCEIGLRFRNSYGCYYQHGLVSSYSGTSAQGTTAFLDYQNIGRNNYFRLDLPQNGDRGSIAELYLLPNGDRTSWLGGKMLTSYPLIDTPDRKGTNLFPILADYTGSNHQLLGVLTR